MTDPSPTRLTEALQDEILTAALPHIAFDGWTLGALRAGARDAGRPATDAARAFPGALEAIEAHAALADRHMADAFAAMPKAGMGTTDKVQALVMLRLEQSADGREAIRRALALLALPHNAPVAARSVHRTVDAIWRAAGDTAVDFSWYTKRALLASVYGTTLLYWLADTSEGFADTRDFLARRLADIGALPRLKARLARTGLRPPNLFRLLSRPTGGGSA